MEIEDQTGLDTDGQAKNEQQEVEASRYLFFYGCGCLSLLIIALTWLIITFMR